VMTLRADGRVGVGTDTPSETLDVWGNVHVSNNISGNSLTINNVIVSTTVGLDEVLNVSNTSTNTIQITNTSDSALDVTGGASIQSNLKVGTTNFFVDTTTGNVGVGTTNPTSKLHVDGDIVTDQGHSINITRDDTTGGPSFGILNTDGSYSGWFGYGSSNKNELRMVSNNNYPLTFWTSATGAGVERMRIAPEGNVGIGLASPAQKLDVAGRIRADTMEIDSYIYHVGDSDTYFGFDGADHFRIVEGGGTRFQVDSNGYIGIGVTSPSNPLHVSASTTSTHTMRITHNDTDATSGTSSLFIDANYSGSDTFTGNKTNAGLNIDLDSSADGGETVNEHRIYGVLSDVRHSGDSDLASGIYSYTRSDHTSGTTTNLKAGDFVAISSGTGINTNIYGVSSLALKDGGSTNTTSKMYGLRGEVEVDAGTCTNAYGVQSHIDRDGGEITTGYLYYGSYAGTVGTKWGIYLAGETKNYFSGDVGIGTNNPLLKLDVRGDIMFSGNLYQLNRGLGGDIVFDRGGYRIHIFNASGIFTSYGVTTADVLLVAGGGGGGQDNGGGGGAGGLIFRPGMTISNGEKVVVVGNGGMGATIANVLPTNGSNSTFNGLTAIGGGYGGSGDGGEQYPTSGGSGGGGQGEVSSGKTGASGTQTSQSGDSGTYGFGNNGGNGGGDSDAGGAGGGGAGAAGSNAGLADGGNGGDGIYQCTFGGVTYNFADMYGIGIVGDWIPKEEERAANWNDRVYFAGGGAGGNGNGINTDIAGGHGGGGSHLGTNDAADRIGSKYYWMHAIPNTGGGGSGGTGAGSDQAGTGGSGICIIRYAI